MIIIDKKATHLLFDEYGEAVLSGSEREMQEYGIETQRLGGKCDVRAIESVDKDRKWCWERVDWGD